MTENMLDVVSLLKKIRSEQADPVRTSVATLERLRAGLQVELSRGSATRDSFAVAHYFVLRLLEKATRPVPPAHKPCIQPSAQILLFDSARNRVLLQRRGPYKHLFPDALTVSANAKLHAGKPSPTTLAAAVLKETGITVDASRFEPHPSGHVNPGRLWCSTFVALDLEEEERLVAASRAITSATCAGPRGVMSAYSRAKRALAIFSVDLDLSRDEIESVVQRASDSCAFPPLFTVDQRSEHRLYVAQLTDVEERHILLRCRDQALPHTRDDIVPSIDNLDADRPVFVPWEDFHRNLRMSPCDYALDLLLPHFRAENRWTEIGPDIIDVDSELADRLAVAGGKGRNTHVLRRMARGGAIPGLRVPKTKVLTASCFRRVVLANPESKRLADRLDSCTDDAESRHIAAELRTRIEQLALPDTVTSVLDQAFQDLGTPIAVRSSATVEDLQDFAAAGQATTELGLRTASAVHQAVTRVWASLYLDGFVTNRLVLEPERRRNISMAVLLQPMIIPEAAGVVLSVFEGGLRPGFTVEAQPGLGEGLVQGQHANDFWLVGPRRDVIVERTIRLKQKRVVMAPDGGTMEDAITSLRPCMSDPQVLELSRLVANIRSSYRDASDASEIDVEFVLDRNGLFHIVQARAKSVSARSQDDHGLPVFRLTVVDDSQVPTDTRRIHLSNASIANAGAVVGRLQIMRNSEHHGDLARAGSIVATPHTNNSWNDVFGKLAGVVTTEGGMTSHAAQNSQALNLPCLVGSEGALDALAPFDGCIVTLDADAKTVYLGRMTLITVDRPLDVWSDEHTAEAYLAARDAHEVVRPWQESVSKRPEVFLEDLGGRWRRRSANLAWFQLDCYMRAWTRLTDYLNDKFADRRPWKLTTLKLNVLVQGSPDRFRTGLLQEQIVNDPRGLYAFVNGIAEFSLDDAQRLFDDRWEAFRDFGTFIDATECITAANVAEVVDRYIDILKWMHMAFWLDAIVEERFAAPQLQYVNPALHGFLRDEAARRRPDAQRSGRGGRSIAPRRADVRPGNVTYLSRVKDGEIYEVLERLRDDTSLASAVGDAPLHRLADRLRESDAGRQLLERVEGWSMRFKRNSEDLRDASDTHLYLVDLQERFLLGNIAPKELLVGFVLAHSEAHGAEAFTLAHIQSHDQNLYWLLRGDARAIVCDRQIDGWSELQPSERGARLRAVKTAEVDAALPEAISAITVLVDQYRARQRSTQFIHDRFHDLRKTLALSKMQFMLKEDGHHLIVPYQRKLRQLMLSLAEQHLDLLCTREAVFDVGADELVALAREEQPLYLRATPERQKMLHEAELALRRAWNIDPVEALTSYSKRLAPILTLLDHQELETRTERTRQAYNAERGHLLGRMSHIREQLATARPMLNTDRDFLFGERAD